MLKLKFLGLWVLHLYTIFAYLRTYVESPLVMQYYKERGPRNLLIRGNCSFLTEIKEVYSTWDTA